MSFALHSAFVALLAAEAWALISLSLEPASSKPPTQVITVAGGWGKLKPAEESIPVTLVDNTPRPSGTPHDQPPEPKEMKPIDSRAIQANKITQMVQDAAAEAQARTAEENQQSLEELTGTLNRVSSDESLEGLMKSLNNVFQTSPRAAQPTAEPVAGDFDFDTAQIHDVRRDELPDGSYRYTAILLDAEGRTLDSELDEAEGARIYEVMALIKQNPLLEKLYRGMLMGLFDKMMQDGENTKQATTQPLVPPETTPLPATPNSPEPGIPFDPFAE